MTPWIDENPQAANVSTSHDDEITNATNISHTPEKAESDLGDDDLDRLQSEVKPKNTIRTESWAMNRFNGKTY
ncbi:MAG: hypothetical protein JAY74_20230 [Candidatus Thiodiazotropha taylori]|nr:hypothetical protein [Candidatus Thiodiazotropha taylori]